MTFGHIEFISQSRKIDNPFEVERKVDIQVNPEQRFFREGVELFVELFVFLIGYFTWRLGPEWIAVIDNLTLKADRNR